MGNFIFSQHFHFLVHKFNFFSTFGSNQDDHEPVDAQSYLAILSEQPNLIPHI